MYGRRRSRRGRRTYFSSRKKYSAECSTFTQGLVGASTVKLPIIPGTPIQGTRKVKNFTLSFSLPPDYNFPLFFALVYVPEGMEPNSLTLTASVAPDQPPVCAALYNPNQYVILSGMVTPGGQNRFRTSLARNLSSGDSISLVYQKHSDAPDVLLSGTLNYAIALG